jgi:hypothetical protein
MAFGHVMSRAANCQCCQLMGRGYVVVNFVIFSEIILLNNEALKTSRPDIQKSR